jgi:hypothetical protein
LAIAATDVTRPGLYVSLYSRVRLSGRFWLTSSRTWSRVMSAAGELNSEVSDVTGGSLAPMRDVGPDLLELGDKHPSVGGVEIR